MGGVHAEDMIPAEYNFHHLLVCALGVCIFSEGLAASDGKQTNQSRFPYFSRKTVTFLVNNSGTAQLILDLTFALERYVAGMLSVLTIPIGYGLCFQ